MDYGGAQQPAPQIDLNGSSQTQSANALNNGGNHDHGHCTHASASVNSGQQQQQQPDWGQQQQAYWDYYNSYGIWNLEPVNAVGNETKIKMVHGRRWKEVEVCPDRELMTWWLHRKWHQTSRSNRHRSH